MRDIQKVLAALASPVRREILGLIWDRELAAGEIAKARRLYDIWTGAHDDDPQLHIALFNGAALASQEGDPVAADVGADVQPESRKALNQRSST